jgi:hypothetical protein
MANAVPTVSLRRPDAAEPIWALVPAANWPNAVLLMVLHVVAWGITVGMLFRLTRPKAA